MNTNKNKWLIPIAFTNIYVIWGITFLAISFGLNGFPPFILSGFRFLGAGIAMIGYLLVKVKKQILPSTGKKCHHRNSHPYGRNGIGCVGRTICNRF
jgi:drug/metabolite transporter (DMT)-like permease